MNVLLQNLVWMDKDSLGCLPFASGITGCQSADLHLTGNRSPKGAS